MARRKTRHGLTVIKGGREELLEEFRETLVEFVICKGAAHRKAKKKLHEIDDRLSRRADLKLVTAPDSSSGPVSG